MSRMGSQFLDAPLSEYLGVTFFNTGNLYDCVSVYPPLTTIGRTGTQSSCSVFNALLGHPTSTLLYVADIGYNPNAGIGAWRHPAGGGPYNPQGAHFAFLSGRPYRWNHADLAANVERIVRELFASGAGIAAPEAPTEAAPGLRVASPGLGGARLTLTLPRPAEAELRVWDAQGRLVRQLLAGPCAPGEHAIRWDGRTDAGRAAASGLYYARLRSGAAAVRVPFLLIR
jgi:hypothetical protein